jgi:tRNA-specific 2-thiouridylase
MFNKPMSNSQLSTFNSQLDSRGGKPGTVLVAMSGGVDSSTAAAVLLEQGYSVAGVTMLLLPENIAGVQEEQRGTAHLRDARAVCRKLGIRHYTMDLREKFETDVIQPFVETYLAGRTPNPCILCNRHLKFRYLQEKARAIEADFLATGHYARILGNGTRKLARGVDRDKDQSYFLFSLDREDLDQLVFPLGTMRKQEVRRKAQSLMIPVHEKPESQDVCFIPHGGLREFLFSRGAGLPGKGRIVDTGGSVLGTHDGACFYTVGQRKGLGIASGEPMYVVRIDAAENSVVLGKREETLFNGLFISRAHWVAGSGPENTFRATVQIRHRHKPAACVVKVYPDGGATVVFDEPQHGVAPGQAAVVYDGDIVLGGGWIERST